MSRTQPENCCQLKTPEHRHGEGTGLSIPTSCSLAPTDAGCKKGDDTSYKNTGLETPEQLLHSSKWMFFPPGWILQEDAPIPAVEHTLLADLHIGHPLKSASTDSSSFSIYICRGIIPQNAEPRWSSCY